MHKNYLQQVVLIKETRAQLSYTISLHKDSYYTALEIYDSQTEDKFSWKNYIEWSKLTHLRELVSLDKTLNGLAFKSGFDSKYD